jgi:hypothetical protein
MAYLGGTDHEHTWEELVMTYLGGTGGFLLVPFPENADTAFRTFMP